MALVAGPRPARPGLLVLLLAIRRGLLGRRARRLGPARQFQHQLDQLVLAQVLEITDDPYHHGISHHQVTQALVGP